MKNETDIEEEGRPMMNCNSGDSHGRRLLGRMGDDRINDLIGSAGLRKQHTNHRTQNDKDAHVANRAAQSRSERGERVSKGDAGENRHDKRAEHKCQEGMHLREHDEAHNHGDADKRRDDEASR